MDARNEWAWGLGGGLGLLALAGGAIAYWRSRAAADTVTAATPSAGAASASAPGPSGGSPAPAETMTFQTLLAYPVGKIPVSDALAWVPAQNAARVVADQGGGYSLFDLAHHPVGYTFPDGHQYEAAQRAAAYLWDLGVDPCPPALYADLAAASQATGVPLPLLLGMAHVESGFLDGGLVGNSVCVPGSCLPGNTGQATGGPVGLLQVSSVAAAQVGVSYAAATASPASNALAAAKYLAYLAGQHGLAPTSTDYAAWASVLEAYGEGPDSPALALATNGSWVAQHTPAEATVTQQATNQSAAPAAYQAPTPVTCTTSVATLSVGTVTKRVTSRVCSNGTRTILSIT